MASSSPVLLNQMTRALVSQSNGIWSFQVSWCRLVRPGNDNHADFPHKHMLYEIQYALEGGLLIDLGNSAQRKLSTGQFLLMPMQRTHSVSFLTPDSNKLVIGFTIKNPNGMIEKALNRNTCQVHSVSPCIQEITEAISPKLTEHNELSSYILSFLLQALVLEMLNIISPAPLSSFESADSAQNDPRVVKCDGLIARNILYPVTGKELAQELGLTTRHLNRLYMAAYGYTVNRQIQKMRISYAQQMLTTTTLSLADIAESMQYSSVYSFIRSFTNIVGIPPGKYRAGTVREGSPSASDA